MLDLDTDTRAATLHGKALTLGARAFDVLVVLAAHKDRVVSKAELLDAVWADRMVEESNLSVQIAGLRKALGSAAISTVPGVGYKLTLAVTAAEGSDAARSPAPVPPAIAQPLPEEPSLAVLPFANLTGRPDSDYLVDGVVTEVALALSRVSGIFVISTLSSFTYRGKDVDLRRVGAELGVRYVLNGSYQQAGGRVRLSSSLVECETGRTLWGDKFEGSADDLFDLQDRAAEAIAGALELRLHYAEAARAQSAPTHSMAAYDLCLRATPMIFPMPTRETLEDCTALLRRALEIDPNYMRAKALLCYAHSGAFAARWWTKAQAQAGLPLAYEVLDSTTEDALALAYAGHHIAYIGDDRRRGLTALKRAHALNPNSATIELLLGWVHSYLWQPEEVIPHMERARRINPLHPQIALASAGLGLAKLRMGDPEAAVTWLEQSMTEYPEFATAHLHLLAAYWALDRREDAQRMGDWLRAKVPDMRVSTYRETRPNEAESYYALMEAALAGTGFAP